MTQEPADPAHVLDDRRTLEALDVGGMLPAVASGAAQVREARVLSAEAGFARLSAEDRPRSVVICGMGGSGIAGDVFAAVTGSACPVPVLTWRSHGLPTWVGAADLVMVVTCSGETEETLSALDEAVRRGCRLLVVAAAGSTAETLASRGRALFVPVPQGRQPRASLWALSTPLVIAGDALGLLAADPEGLELTAVLLERLATRCQPDAETVLNPGKSLALALIDRLPVVWGSSPLSGVSAHRFSCQLNENAKMPAVHGTLPEAAHNQIVAFDGPWAGGERDLFADPEESASPRMHVVLLRDNDEHRQVAKRALVARDLARRRGVELSELQAEGASPFERLASLVAVGDWASTYLALAQGFDPTPVTAIEQLKAEVGR